MAKRKLIPVAAIISTIFVLVVGIGMPKRSNLSEAFYDCFFQQACKCDRVSRWEDCYDEASIAARQFFIDEYNKCKIGNLTLEELSMPKFADMFCNLDDAIWRPCYFKVNEATKVRVRDTALGLYGREEAIALEKLRQCLEPIVFYCTNFPKGCISEG